jgi:glutathione peroxidase
MKIPVLVFAILASATWLYSCIDIPKLGGPPQLVEESSASGSFYDLETKTLEGKPVRLSEHRGQVALVVNVASKCGLTPQYEGLQELHQELAPRGFVVLGFPSNDFWSQEPGSAKEIRTFCTDKYEIEFPLFQKRHVKGAEKDEVYVFLTRELEEPTWNFTKYLVDRNGRVLVRFAPKTAPDDAVLREAIEAVLGAPVAAEEPQ